MELTVGMESMIPAVQQPDEVHIWIQELPISEAQLHETDFVCSKVLSLDEHTRMERMKTNSPLGAYCWMQSRIFLRKVLAAYMQSDARDIALQYGTAGKPYVLSGPQFSLSHTRGRCILAVTWNSNPIGIDMELVRPLLRQEAIVRRFLTEAEREYFMEGPLSEDESSPYGSSLLLWKFLTGKEAWIKAAGQSLCGQWRELDTALAVRNDQHVLERNGQNYVLQSLNMGSNYVISLCVSGRTRLSVRWMNGKAQEV